MCKEKDKKKNILQCSLTLSGCGVYGFENCSSNCNNRQSEAAENPDPVIR